MSKETPSTPSMPKVDTIDNNSVFSRSGLTASFRSKIGALGLGLALALSSGCATANIQSSLPVNNINKIENKSNDRGKSQGDKPAPNKKEKDNNKPSESKRIYGEEDIPCDELHEDEWGACRLV